MKIIDCFMYFDEDLVLDIRLNTLYNKVDKFIIAEATKNHAGQDKKLNFKIENFLKFKDKIHYLIIDDLPINVTSPKKGWHENHMRDQFQRNALERGYKEFNDEDLIMISDIDEIPNPEKIKEFDIQNKYACFLQKNYQSKINLLNMTENDWAGTKICKKKFLKSPQWLRNLKIKKKSFWNFFNNKLQLINNGGWHFSFLKDPDSIRKKIFSYSHQEYNTEEFTNISLIKNKISKGEDLFSRNIKYKKVNIDESFPNYIIKNKKKFKKWIA
jgi:beta-1,4-mannosyl-glycoprotein beta-1,4-N-acetylglucosaminyltransferase|tara:strand:+ start:1686 stop:2498 length:813 start_codon:yes stop_codon:yes gene_type:complete